MAFITRSEAVDHLERMRLYAPILLLVWLAGSARAEEIRPAHQCMTASEIREAVSEHKLIQPMTAVRNAVRMTHAEPLRSQLCRLKDGLQYELTLLRRDGKVVRVTINAVTGASIIARTPPERPKVAAERVKQGAADRTKVAPNERSKPDAPDRSKQAASNRPKPAPPARFILGPIQRLFAPGGGQPKAAAAH